MALVGTTLRGAAGQTVSARALRLGLGSLFRPGAAALAAAAGALIGPPGSMGELSLVNPTTVRVNPALWVVQGTHSGAQGQYLVPNDATVDLTAHNGQHASQFRRNLVAVTVDDSQAAGVASSGTTDRERLHVIEGALSATTPAPLPAAPANTLLLGEVGVPPTGQTVTVTPYNPRTAARGAAMPVIDDALTYPGHGGEPGVFDGQMRVHPTRGPQQWDGAIWYAPTEGYVNATTDLNGNIIVPHGLGATPTGVLITPQQQSSDAIQRLVSVAATSRDSTNFVAYVTRRDTNAPFAGNPITFAWRAFR